MADMDFAAYAKHFDARVTNPEGTPNVALVTDGLIIDSFGERLAHDGYNTYAWAEEPATAEWLGRLAAHIVERQPDAVIVRAHPARRDIFFNAFNGVLPFVLVDSLLTRELPSQLADTTEIWQGSILPSTLVKLVRRAIETSRQKVEQ